MNKYVFVLIVCAVVFLVCFLIDSLLKLLFPKSRLEKSKQVVRPPRRSAVIGVILTFAGAAMLVQAPAGEGRRTVYYREHRGGDLRRDFAVYIFLVRDLL